MNKVKQKLYSLKLLEYCKNNIGKNLYQKYSSSSSVPINKVGPCPNRNDNECPAGHDKTICSKYVLNPQESGGRGGHGQCLSYEHYRIKKEDCSE